MKLQYLAVIFVIIITPISMILSNYIQNQIDTINLQTSYKSILDNSTYDALKAFQINSVNNKYSSISDSKIRDVEASINTFYNSLKTSMSSTKEDVSTFVPAVLFTLYDGYYIYSSYDNIAKVLPSSSDDMDDTVDVEIEKESNQNYQYGLRPYIYYSCEYMYNNRRIVVNYTLDNEITVYGNFGSGYVTKSGYLIDPSKVTEINTTSKTLKYDGTKIEPEVLTEHLITIENDGGTKEGDYKYIVYNNKKVYKEESVGDNKYFWYDNYKKTYLQGEKVNLEKYLNDNGVGFKSISAYEYYISAKEFSEWVNFNLGNITQKNVVRSGSTENETIGDDTNYLSENTGKMKIFATNKNSENDPMLSNSTFNNHRIAIIRKSIETNLTAAIANYNVQANSNYEYTMPIIGDEDWYRIVNNVSIASFMQGIPIGQKYFNNYSVITNTKNEEVINAQSMYILAQDEGNDLEYHQVGCEKLLQKVKEARREGKIASKQFALTAYTDLSFLRQTVKISETGMKYFYPHAVSNEYISGSKNYRYLTGCYNCIVNANIDYDIDDIIKGDVKDYLTGKKIYQESDLADVKKAYLTGLARERYDLYKSNFDLNK